MKRLLAYSLLSFICLQLNAQNYEKVVFDSKVKDGYYLEVKPVSEEIIGVLVLLPGFGQTAETIFPETKIHNIAYLNGILTIAVAGGMKLYADEEVTNRLNKALKHVINQYSIDEEQFIIGGFSAGGTISLRFAGYCYENPQESVIQPKAVFSVDSPVDLFDIWNYFDREIAKDYSEAGVGEAEFVSNIMRNEIGDPSTNPKNYERLTPFHTDSNVPGNEKYLKDISVRVYHDVDIAWQLENRRRSLFDMNALAASEMINRLLLSGNKNAEFMQAKQPGYRSAGFRHPHSWSIVDEIEFIKWAIDNFKK